MKKLLCILLACLFLTSALSCCLAESANTYQSKDIQLDMSGMSGTVVYSMIYNIMSDPTPFLHKIIRIEGYYTAFEDPTTNMVYHSCIIPDATACCAQGIEFVWAGDHVYPDDYPEENTTITVTGKLEEYTEGQYKYLHLINAEVLWIDSID